MNIRYLYKYDYFFYPVSWKCIYNFVLVFHVDSKCEGNLVYYNGFKEDSGISGCVPCPQSCAEDLPKNCLEVCMSGCGCPPGYVEFHTKLRKCIKKEDCPPSGIANLYE